jgi:HEAT repeat protein
VTETANQSQNNRSSQRNFAHWKKFNPYVGPRAFEPNDREFFFGREREANDLFSLIIANKVVLLYAKSGVGKSSLLNAKLKPMLEKAEFEILPNVRLLTPLPPDRSEEEISNIFTFNTISSIEPAPMDFEKHKTMTLADYLRSLTRKLDEEGWPLPRLILFDQFEEIFTNYLHRWQDRDNFFRQVGEALIEQPKQRALFSIREEYIAHLGTYAQFIPGNFSTRYRLENLRREQALYAVKKPIVALKSKMALNTEGSVIPSYGEGVPEKIVADLMTISVQTSSGKLEKKQGEFVEPVQLQIVCQNLWNNLPNDTKEITENHLETIGNADQALTNFYESCIRKTVETSGVAEVKLRNLFDERLITPAGTKGIIFKDVQKGQTEGIPNQATELLAGMHLIRLDWRSGSPWYELTHDRFIQPIRESNREFRLYKAPLLGIDKSQLPERISLIANSGDEKAVEPLMEFIGSDEPGIRRAAIRALGRLKSPKAVERILEVLKDDESTAREEAMIALGEIGDPRVVDTLIKALRDPSEKIAASAATALEKMSWKPAGNHQKAWYFFAKKDWQASVELGQPSIEPLVSSLRNTDIATRVKAINALGEIGDEQVLELLMNAFQDTDATVRKAVIRAIGKIDHERAFQFLIDILQGQDNANDQSMRLLAMDTVLPLMGNEVLSSLLRMYAENESMKLTDEMNVLLSIVGLRNPMSH